MEEQTQQKRARLLQLALGATGQRLTDNTCLMLTELADRIREGEDISVLKIDELIQRYKEQLNGTN